MEDGSIRDRSGKIYKPSTIRSYKASLEHRIYPVLGARKLSSITYPDLQDFCDRLASEGLDGSTIRNTVNPLRRIFKKHRYTIPVNPTTGLEIIAARNKPKRFETPEGVQRRLDALPEEDRAIWATDFYAGLRNGELQALRIENIELFDGWGVLHVEGSWDKVEGRVDTKSTAGTRTVPICEQLYKILDEYLVKLGRTEGLAFGQTATQPYSYNAVRERAERVWRRAGIEPSDFQLHEGRHTFKAFLEATDIRDSRIDRYMGHANHSVQGRYSHQLDAQYLDDAKALSEYLRLADTPSQMQVRTSRAPVSTS